MSFRSRTLIRLTSIVLITIGAVSAQSEQQWYGGAEDVAFAKDLWSAMLKDRLVGKDATAGFPYVGIHPHGAILESSKHTITVGDISSEVVVKRSYRGIDISCLLYTSDAADE